MKGRGDEGANPEDPDEYKAENVFWVPKEAVVSTSGSRTSANWLNEKDNPRLKGVLPKVYARPGLDKQRLLIDLVGTIVGDEENRSKDILGRVYEYFLTQFASAEGKNGGQFYTPSCVVRTIFAPL